MDNDVSLLRPWSFGKAAENKRANDHKLLITPIEQLNMLDGEIKSAPTDVVQAGVDASGLAYEDKVSADTTISAQWLPIGLTNRVTPPDVRRGERVVIWKYADADQYFWEIAGLDDDLRKLETVIYAYSGSQSDGDEAISESNSYIVTMSTHRGMVSLSTSNANGEPFKYKLQFNTKDGVVSLTDDAGNTLEFNSKDSHLWMKNAMDTELHLDKQDIRVNAPRNIDVVAGTRISLSVGGTKLTLLPGSTTLKTPAFIGEQ